MRRIKLKRSTHGTSPARADESYRRDDSPRREPRDRSPKPKSDYSPRRQSKSDRSPRQLSPKRGRSLSSDEAGLSKSKKSKSESSKSKKKSKRSKRSRSPKHRHSKDAEDDTHHKSKKSKSKSSRRCRSRSSDDDVEEALFKAKKIKVSTTPPMQKSPRFDIASKELSVPSSKPDMPDISQSKKDAEKKFSSSQRLKEMSSATVETMFRDFLTSKMTEVEKNAPDTDRASTPQQGSGDANSDEEDEEKFSDIKEAIKDGTISDYISQKMKQIDQEFQQNLARIQDDDDEEDEDEESGEAASNVESVESVEARDPDVDENEEKQDPDVDEAEEDDPDADNSDEVPDEHDEEVVESDSDIFVSEAGKPAFDIERVERKSKTEKDSSKKDSKKDSKSKEKKKHKHKDKDRDKDKPKDKKHKDKHKTKDKDSKSKKTSRHGSRDRSHSHRHDSHELDRSKSRRLESRSGFVDPRERFHIDPRFHGHRRLSRSPSWSSLNSRSRSRSRDRFSKSKKRRSHSRDRRSRSRDRRSRSRDRRSRSRDRKSKKKSRHGREGSKERQKRSSGDDKQKDDEGKDESEKEDEVPDTFIERKELTVKRSIPDEDDDDDFLLKKLGALKKKAASNLGEVEGVKVAPASSIVIGGMKKSGLIRTIKNEGGGVENKESGKLSLGEGNEDSIPLPEVEETGSKGVNKEEKVETVPLPIKKEESTGMPSKVVSTVVKAEDKSEKKLSSITFKSLKINVGPDGSKPVGGETEKAEGEEKDKEKKALPKLGIKISKMSSELISSGLTFDNKRNRIIEEGEVLDSDDDLKSDDSSFFSDSFDDDTDSTDGEIKSESESVKLEAKKKKKEKKKKKDKKKKRKKSKEKDKDKDKKEKGSSKKRSHRSRSRSRSPKRFRRDANGIWSTRERFRRSMSRSPDRFYDRGDRRGGRDYREFREPYMDRYRGERRPRPFRYNDHRYRRSSRSRSRSPSLEIDKERLREIAITKALAAMKSGQGPALNLNPQELARVRAGGKSVDELTDFCKRMAKKTDGNSSDESPTQLPHNSDEDGPFMNHPFKVRDSAPIMMNIKNAKNLPILSASEKAAQTGPLRIQYPVSSGSQHRAKESEWVPVEKSTAPATSTTSTPTTASAAQKPATPTPTPTASIAPGSGTMTTAAGAASAIAAAAVAPAATPDQVFEEPPAEVKNLNISALVSERLTAMKKLSSNPNDVEAIGTIYKANQKVQAWAHSKNLPGQFTGTTGAQILSVQELAGSKRTQAWAKKDQFDKAEPLKSGIGMFLLQKMGWKQGEGLGKNNEGQLEPLNLEVKLDRKGLTSAAEQPQRRAPVIPRAAPIKDLSGKHPVSALTELCNKKKWGSPEFIMVHESGPDHKKNFLFKVKVNRVEYQPSIASTNKKQAKAQCATVCLQALGLLPKDYKLQAM